MTNQKTVVLFSTSACSWCRTAKQYLKSNNIKFKEIDVSKDQQAAQDMVRRTGQMGVPVIMINSQTVIGFDKGKINRLLGISN